MGTHGWGARKKHRKTGHRGGKGMSGSGKRSDQKKTLVNKLYGHKYFGKQGITSRGTKRDTLRKINLREIEFNMGTYVKKEMAKKVTGGFELNISNHKILGNGNVTQKLIILAKSASKTAIEKVKAAGGEIQFKK